MPPFYNRKTFWDWAEFVFVVAAAGAGACSASSAEVVWKTRLAAAAAACATLAASAKFLSKRIEDRTKAAKDADERERRNARDEDTARLQEAHRAELAARDRAGAERERAHAEALGLHERAAGEVLARRDQDLAAARHALEAARGALRAEADRTRDRVRSVVRGVLKSFHELYFAQVPRDDRREPRTILFVCRPADGPGKRLTVFAGVGRHAEAERDWPVDENDRDLCRGPAGEIYYYGTQRSLRAPKEYREGDPGAQAQYAKGVNMTAEEAAGLKVRPRAFLGTAIFVNGRPWGVLVLDSSRPQHLPEKGDPHRNLFDWVTVTIAEAITAAGWSDE